MFLNCHTNSSKKKGLKNVEKVYAKKKFIFLKKLFEKQTKTILFFI